MPLTPIFDTSDPQFNTGAAQWAYQLVSKMDDDSAVSLCTQVIAEQLCEEIAKNERALTRHLNEVISKRRTRLERALDRVVVKSSEQAEQVAALKEAISKATLPPQDHGWIFDENDVRRDRSGRFTFKVNYSGSDKPVNRKYSERIPSMPHVEGKGVPKKISSLPDDRKAIYQEGYMQVAQFLDQLKGLDVDEVVYTVRDRSVGGPGGRVFRAPGSGTDLPEIDPATQEIVGVEIRPKNEAKANQVDLATFGLISALAARRDPDDQVGNAQMASLRAAQMGLLNERMPQFADDWATAGVAGEERGSTNARLYGRMATGAEYLSAFQTPGSASWIATKFGQFVGERGPEAEKVIGPKIRRTMYRYRGTEKKPDAEIVEAYNRARGGAATALTGEQRKTLVTAQNRAIGAFKRREGRDPNKDERAKIIAGVNASAAGVSGTPAEASQYLSARGQGMLLNAMFERVPDAAFYDLQLKAGHTPPSEGLIINRKGDIATQAIGYADDHYLPFNLKNLKGLRDGAYIRTRSVGGPTTEDIYTGLVSGANQIMVVSRSGGFIVTFDDTFRGTRRYNDKAARMVKRYGKILDAVQSEQADRMQIEPSVRRKIRDEVNRTMSYATPKDRADAIKRKEREYKLFPTISDEDRARVETVASQMERNGDVRGAAQYRIDALNDLAEKKAFTWKLNGDGYNAALKSLQEQFPYYISDIKYIQRDELRQYSSEPDRGYVKPRFNRPSQALEGYFDRSIAGESEYSRKKADKHPLKGTGKTPADRVDFQNSRVAERREQRGEDTAADTATESTSAERERAEGEEIKPTAAQAELEKLREKEREEANAKIAAEIWHSLMTGTTSTGLPRIGETVRAENADLFKPGTKEEFIERFPRVRSAFEKFVEANINAAPGGVSLFYSSERDLWAKYTANRAVTGGKMFSRSDHLDVIPSTPYGFSGAAYGATADRRLRRAEMEELNKNTPFTPLGKPLSEYNSKEDFTNSLEKLKKLRSRTSLLASSSDRDEMLRLMTEGGEFPDVPDDLIRAGVETPGTLDEFTVNTHKYWLLWTREQESGTDDTERWEREMTTPPETPPTAPPTPPTPKGPTTPSAPKSPTTTGGAAVAGAGPLVVPRPAELGVKLAAAARARRSKIYDAYYNKLAEAQETTLDPDKANEIESVIVDLSVAIDEPFSPQAKSLKPRIAELLNKHDDLLDYVRDLDPLPDDDKIVKRYGNLHPLPKLIRA